MSTAAVPKKKKMTKQRKLTLLRDNVELYSLFIPAFIVIVLYCYAPLFGYVIAFQDYMPGASFLGPDTKWVGFKHFIDFYQGPFFSRLMGNTIRLSVENLVFGFWVPIVFALLLNEVNVMGYKKFVQTASYLPYFISMVVMCGMLISFLNPNGLINKAIVAMGGTAQTWRNKPEAFDTIYVLSNIWKSFGFNSILYISVITSIDTSMYESARLDGANRFQQAIHITVPSIIPTIAIMLIMAVGSLLNANTDFILLFYVSATYSKADVIGTYIYRQLTQAAGKSFGFSTAVGLIQSLINFALVVITNAISDKLTGAGLF